ncbi:hypothetical protein [Cribrihabitans neustonicus]|uniref:hypothetical protein n=1 Tax=Cribrihabitans neustonicus TaxID=1429085 RepID=UPI003B5CC65A
MIARKRLFAKGILIALVLCPQLSAANGFTSADVLEWEQSAQDSYFNTSVGMVAVVGTQTNFPENIVECLNAWYWPNGSVNADSNASIREAMERFPTLHPQAIVLAVIERECGSFKRP